MTAIAAHPAALALIAGGILTALAATLGILLLALRHQSDTTGASEQYADELHAAQQEKPSPELRTVQTKAERKAEAEAIAKPIDDKVNARIDAALAAFRAGCDAARDKALAGDSMADVRAYYLRADLHRNPSAHTPTETAAMGIRAELDRMLATDGREPVGAGAR